MKVIRELWYYSWKSSVGLLMPVSVGTCVLLRHTLQQSGLHKFIILISPKQWCRVGWRHLGWKRATLPLKSQTSTSKQKRSSALARVTHIFSLYFINAYLYQHYGRQQWPNKKFLLLKMSLPPNKPSAADVFTASSYAIAPKWFNVIFKLNWHQYLRSENRSY